jgi:hypothetical protein
MQRHSHKLLMAVLAVLLVLAASEAVAGGHRWTVVKTGYDPARQPGNVAETDTTTNRSNYRRANGA